MDGNVRVLAYVASGVVERARVQLPQRPESLALYESGSSLLVGLASGELVRFDMETGPGTVALKPGRSRKVRQCWCVHAVRERVVSFRATGDFLRP
jgi:hypothetical protein